MARVNGAKATRASYSDLEMHKRVPAVWAMLTGGTRGPMVVVGDQATRGRAAVWTQQR